MVKKRLKARKGFLVSTRTYKIGNDFKLSVFFQCEQLTCRVSFCPDLNVRVLCPWEPLEQEILWSNANSSQSSETKRRNDDPVSVTLLMDDDLMETKAKKKGTRLRSHWSSFQRGSTRMCLVMTCRRTAFSFLTWLACWPGTGCAGWNWWFLKWTSCSPRTPPSCSSPPLILWETLHVTYPQIWTLRSTWKAKDRSCHVI